jgi:hypothetical protein
MQSPGGAQPSLLVDALREIVIHEPLRAARVAVSEPHLSSYSAWKIKRARSDARRKDIGRTGAGDESPSFQWTSDGHAHWLRAEVRDANGSLMLVSNPVYINLATH